MDDSVINGLMGLRQRIKDISAVVKFQAARALKIECDIDMLEMQRRCPVSEKGSNGLPPGSLRDSGYVGPAEITADGVRVQMSFGVGLPDRRAVFVENDLEAHHNIGQAKFMESVNNESRLTMPGRVAARIDLGV